MPQPRKLDPTTLLSWNAQGMTTVEMQKRLAAQGTTASVDLIRLRLREARRNAQGKPPAPKPQRKDSATHRRQGQLALTPSTWSRPFGMTCRASWTAGATASQAASVTKGLRWRSGSSKA